MRFEFGNADFIRNRIRQRAVVQDATRAMNKQIGGMEPLIYAEGSLARTSEHFGVRAAEISP